MRLRLTRFDNTAFHIQPVAHPAKHGYGIRERARPAGRVLESERLLHTWQVGARSGTDGLGAALPWRRLSPRACGSPLFRIGGLPEGTQGHAGSLAANSAHQAEGQLDHRRAVASCKLSSRSCWTASSPRTDDESKNTIHHPVPLLAFCSRTAGRRADGRLHQAQRVFLPTVNTYFRQA